MEGCCQRPAPGCRGEISKPHLVGCHPLFAPLPELLSSAESAFVLVGRRLAGGSWGVGLSGEDPKATQRGGSWLTLRKGLPLVAGWRHQARHGFRRFRRFHLASTVTVRHGPALPTDHGSMPSTSGPFGSRKGKRCELYTKWDDSQMSTSMFDLGRKIQKSVTTITVICCILRNGTPCGACGLWLRRPQARPLCSKKHPALNKGCFLQVP